MKARLTTTCLLTVYLADWDQKQEDPQKQQLWEQDWDDDNLADDFSQRLKNELAKRQS